MLLGLCLVIALEGPWCWSWCCAVGLFCMPFASCVCCFRVVVADCWYLCGCSRESQLCASAAATAAVAAAGGSDGRHSWPRGTSFGLVWSDGRLSAAAPELELELEQQLELELEQAQSWWSACNSDASRACVVVSGSLWGSLVVCLVCSCSWVHLELLNVAPTRGWPSYMATSHPSYPSSCHRARVFCGLFHRHL